MASYAYGGDSPGLSGAYHWGDGGLGIPGSLIAVGGYLDTSIEQTTEATDEFYGLITGLPSGLAFDEVGEDGGFVVGSATANGFYAVPFDLYRYGAKIGSSTFTTTFGTPAAGANLSVLRMTAGGAIASGVVTFSAATPGTTNLAASPLSGGSTISTAAVGFTPAATGDATLPVMVGAISATPTSTTITASVPAATDNVAIKEYKWRINGGPEVSTGLTRTRVYSALAPASPYNIEVLAYDTSDNPAIAPLIVDVVTLAAVVEPVLVEKTLSITLKSRDLALRPNLTGIYWEWADARGVVTSSGSGLAANSSGQLLVPIRTALLADAVGFLSLDNYTGGNPLDYFAFRGPVRVP